MLETDDGFCLSGVQEYHVLFCVFSIPNALNSFKVHRLYFKQLLTRLHSYVLTRAIPFTNASLAEKKQGSFFPICLNISNYCRPSVVRFGWLVDLGFNGPLRQYFSLYQAASQREGERGKKG